MREKVRFCVALCCSVVMVLLASCRYSLPDLPAEGMSRKTKDSLTYLSKYHYTWNTNLEVLDDSVRLEYLPLKDAYVNLYKGDRVVVAEFSVHPQDSVDSIWVKVAHSQEVQGWVRNKELVRSFVPTDSISQFIHLFSDTHASYFVFIFALFVGVYLLRAFMKKRLQMVYFNPTLSPFKVPFILSVFLTGIWLFIIVTLAVLDDLFRQLTPAAAVFYLLGLMSCCIFCYFFFILTTHIYIGYFFLACFIWLFVKKVRRGSGYKYRCGNCGQKLREKGQCPHCGAVNE